MNFEPDASDKKNKRNSEALYNGGRALDAVLRPYACKVDGVPLSTQWDERRSEFHFTWRNGPHPCGQPTEIYVPDYHFRGREIDVRLSDGSFRYVPQDQTLYILHAVQDAEAVLAKATKKSSKKALLHHISALLADVEHKIESVRLRGIAPAAPVVKGKDKPAPEAEPVSLSHGAARAAAHRKRGELLATTAEDEDDEAARTDFKKQVFQTSAQKRKMNAIKGTVHESVDSCIAYVVFDSSAAVDAAVAISAAALVSAPFEGKVLRFDRVRSQEDKQSTRYEPSREEAKRTAFLGVLDFGQNEQGVREWAEAQIVRERGQPEGDSAWVERVRLVRDRDTGMGKGFAYVLFSVRMSDQTL